MNNLLESESTPPMGATLPVPDSRNVLFADDTGNLPADARRVLVQLLLGPWIDVRRHPKLWEVLIREESVLQSRLHELFLELLIDREQQVAFTRQISSPDIEAPILLRRMSLTFIETALLLYLRQRLTHADAQAERAVVAVSEMLEHLTVYEKSGNTDRAKFRHQCEAAIDKAKKLSLLQKLRASEDRFEVAPTLKLLFPAEEVLALTRIYADLIAEGGTAPEAATAASETDEE